MPQYTTSYSQQYQLWNMWNTQWANSTNSNTTIWSDWNCTTDTTDNSSTITGGVFYARPTPQQQRINEELSRQYQQEEEARIEGLKAAEEKAEKLLLEHLNKSQQKEYAKNKHFTLKVNGNKYKITKGRSGNIHVIGPNKRMIHRLCIHPNEYVPDQDVMLAQKLALETDEAEVLRIANRHAA